MNNKESKNIDSLAHTKCNCKYHIVFAPTASEIRKDKMIYRTNAKEIVYIQRGWDNIG